MAQRLKTDWLLFSTIVAMVGFGRVQEKGRRSGAREGRGDLAADVS